RDEIEHVAKADTLRERALGSALDDRPIGHRIGKRHAELDDVGARLYEAVDNRARHRQRWITCGHVRNQHRAAGVPLLREHGVDAVQAAGFARSATVAISLSPRPERLTRRMRSGGSVGASFVAYASACADSSAGMMPSMRQHAWNAASASSSVIDTYSARPVSLSHACSGPTPG